MKKTGVLLVNLGSPDSTQVKDVRKYLDEFLMDKYVIDVPWLLRALIVKGFILPFRPKKSAEAYKSVWTDEGSPLIVISEKLKAKLGEKVEQPLELAMRYGNPSIKSGIEKLLQKMPDMEEILLIPLYPHYAMATFKTVVEKTEVELQKLAPNIKLKSIDPFYDEEQYLDTLTESIRPYLDKVDYLLFSYHGVPERHVQKTDPSGAHCLKRKNCCQIKCPVNELCYRHHTVVSTEEVAKRLNLGKTQFGQSFQSRLGKDPWLQPYTDKTIEALAKKGVKRLAVVCPAFVADCLETIEEIGMEGKEIFLENGGEHFVRIPCLNDNDAWVDTLAQYCNKYTQA
ncbi:MAG: ferrochelatase [Chitinophagales bacterium]